MASSVAITGASGFVGTALLRALRERQVAVRALVRTPVERGRDGDQVCIGQVGPETRWDDALGGIQTIFHLASVVHTPKATNSLYREVNVLGTRGLAEAAVRAGVRRIVFVSSIAVNGSATGERPFFAEDAPNPVGAYACSKLEAENALRAVCDAGGVEFSIVRPPMIYGRGAPGNFQRLVRLVNTGLPLPFGIASAERSFIGIENFMSALQLIATHPSAAGRVLLVRDAEMASVGELVRMIAEASGRKARLFPMPNVVLAAGLRVLGYSVDAARLFSPLLMDMTPMTRDLGWAPPLPLEDGIRNAVQSAAR